jgi:hypothetical protein
MKREQFLITSTIGWTDTKSTWNAAIRAIEGAARVLADAHCFSYKLTASESTKDDLGFCHVKGSRTWTNQANGCSVVFTITKQ